MFNKKVPICLKQKSIENVIEKNKKESYVKEIKNINTKFFLQYNQYSNIKRFSQIYDSNNLLFPHRKNNSTIK